MPNAQFSLADKMLQLLTAETLLLKRTTVKELASGCGVGDQQARRYLALFRRLGVDIHTDMVPGKREPAKYWIDRGTGLFRRD